MPGCLLSAMTTKKTVSENPTAAALLRVKRKIAKDRAFAVRVFKSAQERKDNTAMERAGGEANVLHMALKYVEEEIKKAQG